METHPPTAETNYRHPEYMPWLISLAKASAVISNFCDHREHAEASSPVEVADAATDLQAIAMSAAEHEGLNLQELYAKRLTEIEERNVLWQQDAYQGGEQVRAARIWRDLQNVQMQHNNYYHPDIAGLSRINQLRHYAFHVTKLTGFLAGYVEGSQTRDDWINRRLPDTLIFSILIASSVHRQLPDTALPFHNSVATAP